MEEIYSPRSRCQGESRCQGACCLSIPLSTNGLVPFVSAAVLCGRWAGMICMGVGLLSAICTLPRAAMILAFSSRISSQTATFGALTSRPSGCCAALLLVQGPPLAEIAVELVVPSCNLSLISLPFCGGGIQFNDTKQKERNAYSTKDQGQDSGEFFAC